MEAPETSKLKKGKRTMIEKLTHILAGAKYLTLTLTDLGDSVQITATVRPKDGSDATKPVQVKADYQIADSLLLSALTAPPKAGKEKSVPAVTKEEATNNETDLFGMEE